MAQCSSSSSSWLCGWWSMSDEVRVDPVPVTPTPSSPESSSSLKPSRGCLRPFLGWTGGLAGRGVGRGGGEPAVCGERSGRGELVRLRLAGGGDIACL